MSDKRIALVIGNAAYQGSNPLKNCINDAALITARLQRLGYEIFGGASSEHVDTGLTGGQDIPYLRMAQLFAEFAAKAQPGDTVVIYYAGHGVQVGGCNYLVPVDDSLDPKLPDLGLIDIKKRLETLARCVGATGAVVALLDACRDTPLSKEQQRKLMALETEQERAREWGQDSGGHGTRGGLGTIKLAHEAGGRIFIGFATAPGDVAYDGPKGAINSPFAEALDRHLATRGLDVEQLYDRIQRDVQDVVAVIGRYQDPWSESNLDRPVQIHKRTALPIVALGTGGFLVGLLICLAIFSKGRLVDPLPPWAWGLGLLFGLLAALGTWRWGSGEDSRGSIDDWRDLGLAILGPVIGFALALAIIQVVPEFPADVRGAPRTPAQELAGHMYWTITILGGLIYMIGTAMVRREKKQPRPSTPLGWLNWAVTWGLPIVIVGVLLRLEYYMASARPVLLAYAMFALLGGVVYAAAITLALRAQGGNFSRFGPFTGAVTVGLLMSAFFAIFSSIANQMGVAPSEANWLLVMLGALWHGLLGAQIGYCFTYYVPDHRRIATGRRGER
jgi:uncharacterized caspase-like protein